MHNNGRFVMSHRPIRIYSKLLTLSDFIILLASLPSCKINRSLLSFICGNEPHSFFLQLSRINLLSSCFRVSLAFYHGIKESTTVKLTECGEAWHKTDCRRSSIYRYF